MSEISEYEKRIVQALARIRNGVDAIALPALDEGESPAVLKRQLEDERVVTAQLEERVKVLKDRQDKRIAELEAQVAAAAERTGALDVELQRLLEVNAELRAVASEMSQALSDGVAEPELVNKAMHAELDALRAARAADRAELDAVLAELAPIAGEAN